MAKSIEYVFIHVEKVSGTLRVQGLRKEKDKQTFLFKQEDQDLFKHPFVEKEIRGQAIEKYRNVKITGAALNQYFDLMTDKFIFNGNVLEEDLDKSVSFDEEGKQLKLKLHYIII